MIYAAAARRHDGLRDDALHGRGRVLRPRLDHGRRPDRGARHARPSSRPSSARPRWTACSWSWRGPTRGTGTTWREASRRGPTDLRARDLAEATSGHGPLRAQLTYPDSDCHSDPYPSPFRAFVLKETRHILRDRQTLAVLLLLPVTMVLLFGFAIRTDVEDVRVVVVDASRDARSQELTRALAGTPALELVGVRRASSEVEPALRSGRRGRRARASARLRAAACRAGTAEVLVVSDGINANYAADGRELRPRRRPALGGRAGAGAPAVRVSTRMRFNPTLESENLFVPGLLAFVLTLVSALMTAISISREKETGTMEVLLVSPLRPIQIVAGKVAPYLVLGVRQRADGARAWRRRVRRAGAREPGCSSWRRRSSTSWCRSRSASLISSRAADQRTAMMGALLGLLIPTLTLTGLHLPHRVDAGLAPAGHERRAGDVVHHHRARRDAEGRRGWRVLWKEVPGAVRDGRRACWPSARAPSTTGSSSG